MQTEIDRLRRDNRVLRATLVVFAASTLVFAGLGVARVGVTPKPVSITSDGTHLYRLLNNGRIDRVLIEAREHTNLEHPDRYATRLPDQWNMFTDW